MITGVHIRNYKALRDVILRLTPMHVLIGPNDTGKTSILEALAALCRSVDRSIEKSFSGKWTGRELVWRQNLQSQVDLTAVGDDGDFGITYTLSVQFPPDGRNVKTFHEKLAVGESNRIEKSSPARRSIVHDRAQQGFQGGEKEQDRAAQHVHKLLSGVQLYRWIPRFLALPNAPDSRRRSRMGPEGFGLTLCLEDILGYDRKLFDELESRFKSIFPEVEIIRLLPEPAYLAPTDETVEIPVLQPADGKGIYFQLKGNGSGKGPLISASQASDGMMLVLAYLTILHLPKPPRLLLIEEPENGIHPNRLKEVLTILRELIQSQQHTQIILTTHSPYVVDLFKPEEVTLCFKDDEGAVQTRRLSESKAVREQIDVFQLGEIWAGDGDKRLMEAASVSEDADE